MKIIVSGSSGFLAKKLIERLCKNNHKVIGFDLKPSKDQYKLKNFKFIKCNLINLKLIKKKLLKIKKADLIIHSAAIQPSSSEIDTNKYFDTNVKGTMNILILAKKLKVRKIIFSSSFSVYGTNCKNPIDENVQTMPQNFYGLTKILSEKLLEFYSNKENINIIILRFDGIYGKGQNLPGMINYFKNKMLKNEKIKIFNGGKLKRNQVFINDAVQSIILSIKKISSTKFKILNIGGKKPVSTKNIVKLLQKRFYTKSRVIYLKKKINFTKDKYLNINKAKNYLKYQPKDIEKVIKNYHI